MTERTVGHLQFCAIFSMEIKNIGYLLVADLFILNFSMGDRKLHLSILFFQKCLKESPPNMFPADNGFIWEPKNHFCETSPDSRYSRIAHILAFYPISLIFLNKSWPNMLRMRTRLRNATNGKTMQISSPLVKLCREHANKTGSFFSNKFNMAKHGKTWQTTANHGKI